MFDVLAAIVIRHDWNVQLQPSKFTAVVNALTSRMNLISIFILLDTINPKRLVIALGHYGSS